MIPSRLIHHQHSNHDILAATTTIIICLLLLTSSTLGFPAGTEATTTTATTGAQAGSSSTVSPSPSSSAFSTKPSLYRTSNSHQNPILLRSDDGSLDSKDDNVDDDAPSPPHPTFLRSSSSVILIVGSANADTFLPVDRLPQEGENLTLLPFTQPMVDIPGGKGCTQAVAISRLLHLFGDDDSSSDSINDEDMEDIHDDSRNAIIIDENTHVGEDLGGRMERRTRTPSIDETESTVSSPSTASSFSQYHRTAARFVGQVGHDEAGAILLTALHDAGVDTSYCGQHHDVPSGRGYVFLAASSGSVSAIVSGGTNTAGWIGWKEAWDNRKQRLLQTNVETTMSEDSTTTATTTTATTSDIEQYLFDKVLDNVDCILLQREIPEYVNLLIASCAKEKQEQQQQTRRASVVDDSGGSNRKSNGDNTYNKNKSGNILVFLDIGGEDRPISTEMLHLCDYVTPNTSELKRLVESTLRSQNKPRPDFGSSSSQSSSTSEPSIPAGTTTTIPSTSTDHNPSDEDDIIVKYARILQDMGAQNVLVTRGSSGSTLVPAHHDHNVIHQRAILVPNKKTRSLYNDNIDDGSNEVENKNDTDDHYSEGGGSGSGIVDETGAGDCFRAAFAVALLEGHSIRQCLQFASAAGSCSVQVNGAVPSAPTRSQVLRRLLGEGAVLDVPRGDGQLEQRHQHQRQPEEDQETRQKDHGMSKEVLAATQSPIDHSQARAFLPRRGGHQDNKVVDDDEKEEGIDDERTITIPSKVDDDDDETRLQRFPFLIGSRLNSMKDRPDLWKDGSSSSLQTPHDYVQRQATIVGLTCIDFNYPQHFDSYWSVQDAKTALAEVGLAAGAICLRYPSRFARGAMNHPDEGLRREAIEITKRAAETAVSLGCKEVVIWSAYDGYDYPFQVDYDDKWDQLVHTFQELCDAYPAIKFSLEYKPTDENTRFFTVPSTGAALLLVDDINRPNMGLTLDVGHMLMSGENPGQSIAMVGRRKKLFGIQLNDGYTRLAAEDGLMFGSVHPTMALEVMYQLRRTNFDGHIYFDTFPQRSDPILEAEYNIRQVKRFWYASSNNIDALDDARLRTIMDNHDAIGALELVNKALMYGREGLEFYENNNNNLEM